MDVEYTPGPLYEATKSTPTALWNDSSDLNELKQSISYGGVGATCNPVIAYTTISKYPEIWTERIRKIAEEHPTWGESEIGWQAVKDMSVEAAELLEPIYWRENGRNGRLSVQTDPRFHRDAKKLTDQAEEFHNLAPNIVVKIPATKTGIEAIEDATYRGVSCNVTVSFTVPQAVQAAAAIERGLERRDQEGLKTDDMGPVVTIMVGRLDDWLKEVVARDRIMLGQLITCQEGCGRTPAVRCQLKFAHALLLWKPEPEPPARALPTHTQRTAAAALPAVCVFASSPLPLAPKAPASWHPSTRSPAWWGMDCTTRSEPRLNVSHPMEQTPAMSLGHSQKQTVNHVLCKTEGMR